LRLQPEQVPTTIPVGQPGGDAVKSNKWALFTILFFLLFSACGWWIVVQGHDKSLTQVHTQYIVTMALIFALCAITGWLVQGRIDGVLIDDRNRVSLSRAQWILWFALIIGGYFAAALWNVANGLTMPVIQNQLLVLLGISSGSAVTSNLIIEAKKPDDPADAGKATLAKNADADDASWSELYLGEEQANKSTVDISRLQQLVITILLAIAFISLQWAALAKPDDAGMHMPSFDDNSSFLWLLGLSHAAYLAYKAPTKKPA
jgi:small-conductance mechanosensitive channel